MPVFKDSKTNTYYCKFYYVDWQGNRKQKMKRGFKLQKDAKAFEADFLANTSTDCTMSFDTLIKHYFEDRKARVKPTTFEMKYSLITTRILPYFKNFSINEITPAIINKYQNYMINNEKKYSATYLRTINSTLSAIFNYAVKYFRLRDNPVRIAGTMGKAKSGRMDIWTIDDFKKFIESLGRNDDFAKAHLHRKAPIEAYILCFKILFFGGLREGEALALTVNDFDVVNDCLNVNKTLAVVNGKTIIQAPKTLKSNRRVPLPKFLCNEIQQYIDKMVEASTTDALFPFLNKHSLLQAMAITSKLAGVKKIRIHDLRHSHASLLIERGFSPIMIADRLGHEKIQTTIDIYSHLYPNKDREISKNLENLAF